MNFVYFVFKDTAFTGTLDFLVTRPRHQTLGSAAAFPPFLFCNLPSINEYYIYRTFSEPHRLTALEKAYKVAGRWVWLETAWPPVFGKEKPENRDRPSFRRPVFFSGVESRKWKVERKSKDGKDVAPILRYADTCANWP